MPSPGRTTAGSSWPISNRNTPLVTKNSSKRRNLIGRPMAKILVADDEPTVLQFCAFALERDKHTVLTAETGPETLGKLMAEKPDLLLLDVMLPGMDGYTLQLRMSENEALFKVPVIIMTALKPALSLFSKFAQVAGTLAK